VVTRLLAAGADVRVLTRRPPARQDVEHVAGDLATGAGIAAAVSGVDAVVDAANVVSARASRARAVLLDGTRRLAEAGAAAGVTNHVLVSIVGIDRTPMSYYRVKVEQERALERAGVPWTILRATQFHQLVDGQLASLTRLPVVPLPDVPMQPIDPDVVAAVLVPAALAPAAGRLPDVAGPEVLSLRQAAHQWLTARHRHRRVVRVPLPGRLGKALREGSLTNPSAGVPGPTFADYLGGSGPG
jgi:uncharacterized protein YbjT (DUF2867 family)